MNRSAISWAIGGALRLAIGAAVIALVLATTLTGEAGERLATTAYLAAIFAAVALVAQRFLPAPDERRPAGTPAFPVFLTYSTVVAILVMVAAALASEPGAEVALVAGCAALVAIAVLARSGALAAFNATLQRGGFFVGATRYAAAAGVAALLVAALAPDSAEGVAALTYRLAAIATICIAASLVAPTRFGIWLRRISARAGSALDRLSRGLVFERTATYTAVIAVAAMLSASLLPMPFAEPFAVAAYAAAFAAAFAVAMECRRLRS